MKIRKIKLAVVGIGVMGVKHIDAINKTSNAKLTAVVDFKKNSIINKINANFYSSIKDMFKSETIDGVIIATPNSSHFKDGLEVIRNKCPVLIEKPITIRSEDTDKLITEAKKKRVQILVGHHRRHNPVMLKAKELIDNNLLGKVRTVNINCQMFKPNNYFKEAHWKKNDGAGPIFVNLIHDLDLMNFLFGKIVKVFSMSKNSLRGFANEDVSGAVLEFKNGIIATFITSDSVASPWSWELTARENDIYPSTEESSYLIGGTKASMSLPNLKLWQHSKNGHWFTPISGTKYPYKFSDPLVNQIEHFCKVIEKKEKPIITASIANETIKVIEAIKLSSKSKKLVELKN